MVELLVVIAIIGVLVALLLPAVQAAREAARRMQCNNNLKQLTLALHNYESTHKTFPMSRIKVAGQQETAWSVMVLPFVEQAPLYDQYDFNVDCHNPVNYPVTTGQLSVWQCPSAPSTRTIPNAEAQGEYVLVPPGGFGFADYGSTNMARKGAYVNNNVPFPGGFGPRQVPGAMEANRITRIANITDGLSNTLMLAERAARPNVWINGRRGTFRGDARSPIPSGERQNVTDEGWGWADMEAVGGSVNGSDMTGLQTHTSGGGNVTGTGSCLMNCMNVSEYYSFHPAGMNVSMADGSVRFVSETVSAAVLPGIITKSGGEVIGDF